MIITKKKSDEVIDAMTAPFDKLFVVGCGTCATKCMTGGEEQVTELVDRLGDKIVGYQIVEERNVVPHECHPYTGKIVLLTKPAS